MRCGYAGWKDVDVAWFEDKSNLLNDYYQYGVKLHDAMSYIVSWDDFKIMNYHGKYFYMVSVADVFLALIYDPAMDKFSLVRKTKYIDYGFDQERFGSYSAVRGFFYAVIDNLQESNDDDFKPGQTRLEKRAEKAKSKDKSKDKNVTEFANTGTASTGMTGPISNGALPKPGSAPILGGQAAGRMNLAPKVDKKKWTGHELSETIFQKEVVRDGIKTTKDISDKEDTKVIYEDGKPKEVKIKQSEHRNKENGQTRGQPKRDSQMQSLQTKRASSLSKRD